MIAALGLMACNAPGAVAADAVPWLGVYMQTVTPELGDAMNYDGKGVLVSRVVADSPADAAGIERGDVIVSVNSRAVSTSSELSRMIRDARVGQTLSIVLMRDRARRTVSAKLVERPGDSGEDSMEWSEAPEAPEPPEAPEAPEAPRAPRTPRAFVWRDRGGDFELRGLDKLKDLDIESIAPGLGAIGIGRGRLGVQIQSLGPDLGSYFGRPDGKGALVLDVVEHSPAEKAGIKAGDVITKVGDKAVDDASDLRRLIAAEEGKVTLTVIRTGAARTIEAELEEDPVQRIVRRYEGRTPRPERDVVRERIRVERDEMDNLRREMEELRREMRELREGLRR
jgi:predicted metalloprotease with PDZ domain